MFCSKCGKEIADGSSFCNACGAAVGAGQGRIAVGPLLKTSPTRLLLLCSNALIVWLAFQESIVLDIEYTYAKFTALKFLDYAKKVEGWGVWDADAVHTAGVFVLLMSIAVIALAAAFCLKEALDHENKVEWGYNVSEVIISITVVAIIFSFFASKRGFSAATNVYIILALAGVNRWWLLPKHASEEWWRKQEEKKREREKQKGQQRSAPGTQQEETWECTACKAENAGTQMHCQNCGKQKYR